MTLTPRERAIEEWRDGRREPAAPTLTLRPRQHQALADLRQAYATGSRAPILVAPTGFGKTAVATEVVRKALGKDTRVGFLAH